MLRTSDDKRKRNNCDCRREEAEENGIFSYDILCGYRQQSQTSFTPPRMALTLKLATHFRTIQIGEKTFFSLTAPTPVFSRSTFCFLFFYRIPGQIQQCYSSNRKNLGNLLHLSSKKKKLARCFMVKKKKTMLFFTLSRSS